MKVRLAAKDDAKRWDEFVAVSVHGSFMQTWAWGEFLAATRQDIWRGLIEDGRGNIRAVAQVTERRVKLGLRWLYVPRGPVGDGMDKDMFAALHDFFVELARQREALFIRIDPPIIQGTSSVDFGSFGWQVAEHQVQPQHTLLLDVRPRREQLLAQMHPKWRYNIRLAERKGVTVRFSTNPADIDVFLQLAGEVSARSSFRYHPASYYRHLLETLGPHGMAEVAVAEYEGQPLGAHIMVYSGKVATYVHGASSRVQRELMASHLLYWRTIERAKERGYATFDFYGVAPEGAGAEHPWFGVTKMKRGFGGKVVSYIPAHDLLVRKFLYRIFSVARHIIRGT